MAASDPGSRNLFLSHGPRELVLLLPSLLLPSWGSSCRRSPTAGAGCTPGGGEAKELQPQSKFLMAFRICWQFWDP